MSNFVGDLTDLPYPVTDLAPIPDGQDPTKWMDAEKYNKICQAAIDLRGWILTGLAAGSYTNVSLTVDADGRVTAVSSGSAGVPTSRTITGTAPVRIDGGASADLSANRTISVVSFGSAASGVVSASGASANVLRGDNSWSTLAQLTAALNAFTSTLQGLVPPSGGGTTNFLRADGTWAAAGSLVPAEFGDGVDGTVIFDGSTAVTGYTRVGSTYTQTREVFFVDATVNSGVVVLPDGWPIYVNGTLTNNGRITVNGQDASGQTPGARAFTSATVRPLPDGAVGATPGNNGVTVTQAVRGATAGSVAGGASSTSNAGTTGGAGQGGGGGGGGVGGGTAGGTGGPVTLADPINGDVHDVRNASRGRHLISSSGVWSQWTCGSGGGGAGLGGTNGGAGGASGGWMTVWAATFAGSGTYESSGGAGSKFDPAGGGGGGGGGSGGVIVMIKHNGSFGTTVLTGGAGGPGGSLNGGPGGAGGVGLFFGFTH